MDVHTKEQRSRNMSAIKAKNTKPEIAVRKILFSMGYRYRLQSKDLPGKPDIVLPKYKTVIFVHGCFWHQHQDCKYAVMPESNRDFWKNKLKGNIKRDKENLKKLQELGWKVITVWECQLKNIDKLKERLTSQIF
ncbi:MAG: DNA mismatch endonuclease Vsr [Candidatus Gastranaerophilales bacterium]|nr:DNA mismatch endonuclease Vsr [Candidatus Gastranaerophilales bacterium]